MCLQQSGNRVLRHRQKRGEGRAPYLALEGQSAECRGFGELFRLALPETKSVAVHAIHTVVASCSTRGGVADDRPASRRVGDYRLAPLVSCLSPCIRW